MSDAAVATPGSLIREGLGRSGMSIDDLARSTRLRPGLLEQMEADDFTGTGGDVYARGHLRVIAGVLDIDTDHLLAAYDEAPIVRRPPAP